jgi:hypothetical protein
VPIPETAVGKRLAWVMEQVNGQASKLTAGDVDAAFASSMLAQVSSAQLISALRQIAADGPYAVTYYDSRASDTQAEAIIAGRSSFLRVRISVEAAPPNLITGLLFTAASGATGATSWSEIDAALSGLASEHGLLAAELGDGGCEPIHGLNADQSLAIGSAFKLYVLGELAGQVEAGKASWNEQLAIRDELKSLPSGTMQSEAAGTEHPLSYFARQMISISDNTAADHLIDRLGRDRVEARLAAMGMADPSRNMPFLSTREMFVLKADKSTTLRQQYVAADTAGRRALLEGQVASTSISLIDMLLWTGPREIDTIEWFASNADLCRAMQRLRDVGAKPATSEVLDILAVNPGVIYDQGAWAYVGYKGGSEPGVLNMTFLLRRADGRWFALSMTLDDPASAADHTVRAAELVVDAMRLLSTAP